MGNIDISRDSASSQGKPNRQAEAAASRLLVSDLDWSAEEAKEARARRAAPGRCQWRPAPVPALATVGTAPVP